MENEKCNSLTTLTGKCKCKTKSTKTVSVTWN